MRFRFPTPPTLLPPHVKAQRDRILRLLAIGLLIRVLVIPLFASPDFVWLDWASLTLLLKGQLVPSNEPPLVFFILSGFYWILRPILPAAPFNAITSSAVTYTPQFFLPSYGALPGIHTFIALLKMPFVFFDVIVAFTILRLVDEAETSIKAFKLWLFNPVTIYVTYIVGQYDVVLLAPLLLSLLFVKKRKRRSAALLIGISGAVKAVGLVFLLPLLIMWWNERGDRRLSRLVNSLVLLIVGLLPIAVDYLITSHVPAFYESANLALPAFSFDLNGFFGLTLYSRGIAANPLALGIFTFVLDYGLSARTFQLSNDVIYLLPMLYAFFLIVCARVKNWRFERIWKSFTIFLLLFYSFSLFHVQWFLWVQPFLILLLAQSKKGLIKPYAVLLLLYFVYTLYWDQNLTTQLLFPTIPQAAWWPGPIGVLNQKGLPGFEIVSLFRSFFSAVCLYFIYLVLRSEGLLGIRILQDRPSAELSA